MRTARYLSVLTLAILSLAISISAQRTKRPAPKPTPVRTTISPEVSAAKQKVANQLHNVNVFVEKMGSIAVAIENSDKDAAARRLKPSEVAANEENKKKVITAIRILREGLVSLETDFRTKPQLSAYLTKIQGISSLCAQSEDSAIAGKFVASKEPLRQVSLKLNDTLAVIPGPASIGSPSNTVRSQANTTSTATPAQNRNVSTQPTGTSTREPAVGMTVTEVLQSSWGEPSNKRSSKTANGTTEVWTYTGTRTVYFFNGKVSNVVK